MHACTCMHTHAHTHKHTHTHATLIQGIPGSKVDFIRFVQGVRSFREGMEAPMIVHCRYIQLVMNKIISEL